MDDILSRLRDLRPGYGNIIDAAIAEIEDLRKTAAISFTHDQYHAGCDAIRNERNRAEDEAERLRALLAEAVDFYDGIDRPHAEGEAELLDRMASELKRGN